MMDCTSCTRIIVHDSTGLRFQDGSPNYSQNSSKFSDVEAKIKCFATSLHGKRLAWIAEGEVCVVEGPDWKRIGTLRHPKAQEICFSPQGSYLAIWDTYIHVHGSDATPNLSIYSVSGRKLMKAFAQRSQTDWKPQWTKDESIMARLLTSEVHFYKGDDLETAVNKKCIQKLRSFSISPSSENHYVNFFVPSLKGAPAYVHLFKYPSFKENTDLLASKSFFKVDTVEAIWNMPCTAVLLLTTAEVDKSCNSYYGEQMLFYLSTRGSANRVTFSKDGIIRSVSWLPEGREFIAVYGTAPCRATIYNHKCDPVKEFGENARNIVLPNPVGNLVMLGGLGNISSRFEIWNVVQETLIGHQEMPDITHMEWSPCGQFLLTSTCSPRLRVNNGYRIWHYTGVLMYEKLYSTGELLQATWLPNEVLAKPFEISTKAVKGIQSAAKTASNLRYVPPSQRTSATLEVKKYLSQRDSGTTTDSVNSQKKKAAKKKKKPEEVKIKNTESTSPSGTTNQLPQEIKENKTKRSKNIKKKLESIQKLKADLAAGKFLDQGQLSKIESEQTLIKEMEQLMVS